MAPAESSPRDGLRAAIHSSAEEAEHLADLANGLLLLSRANDGGLVIHREDVDLAELVEQVVGHVEVDAMRRHLRLEVDAPHVVVDVDRTRVRQALDNILSNALQHTPPGGTVQLMTSCRNGEVVITVEDSGSGFPVDLLPDVLDPFTAGRDSLGSGLGLSIVLAIAQAHGGGVRIENLRGGGARVVLTILLGAAESSDRASEVSARSAQMSRRVKQGEALNRPPGSL